MASSAPKLSDILKFACAKPERRIACCVFWYTCTKLKVIQFRTWTTTTQPKTPKPRLFVSEYRWNKQTAETCFIATELHHRVRCHQWARPKIIIPKNHWIIAHSVAEPGPNYAHLEPQALKKKLTPHKFITTPLEPQSSKLSRSCLVSYLPGFHMRPPYWFFYFFIFLVFGDEWSIGQCQSTGGSWPLDKFSCQVEKRFHNRESNCQSLPWDLGLGFWGLRF